MLDESKLLHQYPIIEMTVAALMGLVTIYYVWRAERQRRDLPPSAQMPQQVQMFMDGPLTIAIKHLAGIENCLIRWEEERRISKEIADRIEPSDDLRDRSRWDDMFKMVREALDHLRRLGEPRARR